MPDNNSNEQSQGIGKYQKMNKMMDVRDRIREFRKIKQDKQKQKAFDTSAFSKDLGKHKN